MSWHTIPNWLVLSVAAAFYGYALAVGLPAWTVAEHTLVALVAVIGLFVGPLSGQGGAAKLAAAFVLWFGIWGGVAFIALSFLACGVAGLAMRRAAMPYMPFAFAAAALMIVGSGLPGNEPAQHAKADHAAVTSADKRR